MLPTIVLCLFFAILSHHRVVVTALSPPRCPSNQQYLPAVQFGCPASCDQPVPMCRATLGPGCGCPKGTVLAGEGAADPNRCIPLARCPKKCPTNQRFLPNVQVGCPSSCDQPVPLCKAPVRPGCGCPPGKVLAGSSRPRNPLRCIPSKRCTLSRKCPIGTPLLGPNRNQLVCGPKQPPCPESAACHLPKPQAAYGVCCSKPMPPPPSPICKIGLPLVGKDGDQLFCGRGPSRVDCPTGSSCVIDPADRFAVCCKDPLPPPVPLPKTCVVSGCNGEICAAEPMASICLAPTCAQSCLRFASCGSALSCSWDKSSAEYQKCIASCNSNY